MCHKQTHALQHNRRKRKTDNAAVCPESDQVFFAPAYNEICGLYENVARGHTLLGRTGISGLSPLMGMRTALTGPHLEQENVRHSTSLRVTCGSMRLRYVNLKQTGHRPTVMTDIVSLHDGSMPPLDWAALNRFGRRCRPRFNRRPSVTKYARRFRLNH